ncbi:hypothetical protein B2G88_18355 [Natronolimnobius baerhuensis]|uniref:GLUG domain-containing protein n=1 Tax=Natronolimnobius baerhuensis TaxID=253108 RepID=A0A202E433_9EURY|nr:hypothetical protein B2G88_18355 [Natronolimnobius baerhuensis]
MSTVAVTGCLGSDDGVEEIEDWHDLNAVRDEDPDIDKYVLITNLDEATAGYDEHVGNSDGGWLSIGNRPSGNATSAFNRTFDGNGHEIADLKIDRRWTSHVGMGLFSWNMGTIKNITVTNADITGQRNVGGLVGRNEEGEVLESSVCEADITGERNVGGLVGENRDGEVLESFTCAADITGETSVGGFVGRNTGEVLESWAGGEVTGEDQVGGFVGANAGGEVVRSWAAVDVIGDDTIGGFVGEQDAVVSAGYWDTEATGQTDGVGDGESDRNVVGLSTDEMQGERAAENMNALDFEETWVTQADPDGFPVLQWLNDDNGKTDAT